jgi:chromate transporter
MNSRILRAGENARASLEVLGVALRLGLTSFGGPVAHLGYFRQEYVARRRWLDERQYADLVALCQFLPGPASSQVGIAVGLSRAGLLGGVAAWLGFTLPSAIALIAFAAIVRSGGVVDTRWVHGLQLVAVAVVAQAVWGMGRNLCPDRERASIALIAAIVALNWQTPLSQVLTIAAAGLTGWRLLPTAPAQPAAPLHNSPRRRTALCAIAALFILLIGLPIARHVVPVQSLSLFDSFFRVGALVFGGGHVVLPLLQTAVVPPHWVTNAQFTAGYGAAQAVPGPLFTFAAYLGAVEGPAPHDWLGGAIALVAIFLPSFLLVVGAVPFWDTLRASASFQSALRGINAAVVGLLIAALYSPIWLSAVHTLVDVSLALAAFGLLALWRLPPWAVVLASCIGALVVARH